LAKGFKDKNGKFRPTERQRATRFFTQNPNLEGAKKNIDNKQLLQKKFSKSDIERTKDFYIDEFEGHPQEWVMILDSRGFEIENDNLGSNAFVSWDELSEKDKNTLVRFFIEEKKEVKIAEEKDIRLRERLRKQLSKELSDALGLTVDPLKVHIGTTGFTDEKGNPKSTKLTFSAKSLDEESMNRLKKSGFKILNIELGTNQVHFKLEKKLIG